jgi:hypothetical protein
MCLRFAFVSQIAVEDNGIRPLARLPKTSGFQVDSAGIGLYSRAAEPGDARLPLSFRRTRTGSERLGFAMKFVLACYGSRRSKAPLIRSSSRLRSPTLGRPTCSGSLKRASANVGEPFFAR